MGGKRQRWTRARRRALATEAANLKATAARERKAAREVTAENASIQAAVLRADGLDRVVEKALREGSAFH